jgi:Phage tail protein
VKPWEPIDCETLEYRSAAGDTVRVRMLAGVAGRMMPPIQTTTIPRPAGNGSRYLGSAHLERLVSVPIAFPGTLTDRAELRRWARVLDPTAGVGLLSVIGGPNPGRQLRCVYDSGFDALEESLPNFNEGSLVFRAAWPYWEDGTEQSVDVAQGATGLTWFPFLPLVLGASDAFAVFTITNVGDVEAWPIVTVTGPGQDATATNMTTGDSWTVSGAIPAGSQLIVDHRPGRKAVTQDGANAFGRLAPGSSLWPLVPGANRIQVSLALTSSVSLASFGWRNQWLAA